MTHFTHIVYAPKKVRELAEWRWPGFVNRGHYGYSTEDIDGFDDHAQDPQAADFAITLVEGEGTAHALADKLAEAHPGTVIFVSTISHVYTRKVEPMSSVTTVSPKGVLPA